MLRATHPTTFVDSQKGGSMKAINLGRVILGGLLAGVILNIGEFLLNEKVIKAENEAAMKALGKTMPESGQAMAVWMILGFVTGIALIWLYAAIRPRFGAGPGTAVKAGLLTWFFLSVCVSVIFWNLGLMPFVILATVWELVLYVIAAVAGAWLYKEEGA